MRILCMNWSATDEAELESQRHKDVTFDIWRSRPGQSVTPPIEICRDADGVINYTIEGLGRELADFGRCRIAVRAGVGYDNMDLAGWAARGVPVCNVPDYGTTEVADAAIALMLSLARGTTLYDAVLHREGAKGWNFAVAPLIRRLRGAVFGVVGLGRIGLAAANRAAAFGMRVVFYDPYVVPGLELAVGFGRVHKLADLLSVSDVISLHTPATEETTNLINAERLQAMKPGAILVNTARGAIVDLDALYAALKSGQIGGAALDVLAEEPLDVAHPLIAAWRAREPWIEGRLALSPHAAFYSPASVIDLRLKAVECALTYLQEGRLTNCVNTALLGRE
jgi:D-3-phosphoglycerate dehydrogenase/C-terminal binding protein